MKKTLRHVIILCMIVGMVIGVEFSLSESKRIVDKDEIAELYVDPYKFGDMYVYNHERQIP